MIMGKDDHKELVEHALVMSENESIAPEDMDLVFMTDSVEEMRDHLQKYAVERFGLVRKPIPSRWWLGEHHRKAARRTWRQ